MELLPARNLTHPHSRMPSKYNPKVEQTVFEFIPQLFQCPQKRAWMLNRTWFLGEQSALWGKVQGTDFAGTQSQFKGERIRWAQEWIGMQPELSQWPTIRPHVSAHDSHIPLKSVTIKCHKAASQRSPPYQKAVMLTGESLYVVHYSSTPLKGNKAF